MRFAVFLVVSVTLALASTVAESTQAQPPGGKGGKGGKGGFGGQPDLADRLFDLIAKGKDSIAITDAPTTLRHALEDFAKASKIDSGLLTRKQFQAFYEIMQLSGGGPGKGLDIDGAAAQKFPV